MSEYAAGVSEDSIDSVIEEIIEAPEQEGEHGQGARAEAGMEQSATPDDRAETPALGAGGHLLDKVVASNGADAIEAAAADDEMENRDDQHDDALEAPLTEDVAEEKSEVPGSADDTLDFIKSEVLKQHAEEEENRQGPAQKATVRSSIRVDAEKIDYLMNQVGELVVSRAYFAQLVNEMRGLEQQLLESSGVTKSQLKPLHEFSFRLSEAGVHLGRVSNELQRKG